MYILYYCLYIPLGTLMEFPLFIYFWAKTGICWCMDGGQTDEIFPRYPCKLPMYGYLARSIIYSIWRL